MTTEVVTLVLGLAFLFVVLVLGIFVLRSPRGQLQATAQAGKFGVTFGVTNEAKAEAAHHLDQAVAEKKESGEVQKAKEILSATTALLVSRLLWVDDHPDNNIYEVLMLEKLGISITTSTSTEAAMTYLENSPFDLLITDLGRGRDKDAGIHLVQEMRNRGYGLPAIVYSLDRGIGREEQARSLQISAFAVTPDQLLAAVLRVARGTESATSRTARRERS